jgi:hypothetical protein
MRRTKATLIYRRTKNPRAVQILLGHTKLESTVRYFGIEVDDALTIAEQRTYKGRSAPPAVAGGRKPATTGVRLVAGNTDMRKGLDGPAAIRWLWRDSVQNL